MSYIVRLIRSLSHSYYLLIFASRWASPFSWLVHWLCTIKSSAVYSWGTNILRINKPAIQF